MALVQRFVRNEREVIAILRCGGALRRSAPQLEVALGGRLGQQTGAG